MSTEPTFSVRILPEQGPVVFYGDAPAKNDSLAVLLGYVSATMLIPEEDREAGLVPKAEKKKGPLQLRAEALFKRRISTPLSPAESRAMRGAKACIVATSEDEWLALERFYAAPKEGTFRRHELAQLLNNWNGEVIKAVQWCKERGFSPKAPPVEKPEDIDPPRWREYITTTYPGHPYAIGGEQENAPWRSIDRQNRKMLMEEIKALDAAK